MFGKKGKLLRHIWLVLLAAALMGINAAAAETVLNTPSDCSINLQLAYTDATTGSRVQLTGGQVTVYKVSDALESNGDKYFNPQTSGQFQSLANQNSENGRAVAAIRGYSSSELTTRNASLARILAANRSGIEGTSGTISNGTVTIGSLTPGLYLMVQTQDSPEKAGFEPFLFSLPDPNGNYQITASPKPSVMGTVSGSQTDKPKEDDTEKPKNPSGGTVPSTGTTGGRLPQTGQLWWPVPVLLLAGLLLVIVGAVMRRRGRRQEAVQGS